MPEYGTVGLKFRGRSYPLTMKIAFDSDRKVATASVVMPTVCVKEKRTVLGELLRRINCVTTLGQWKLNMRDGECRLKYTCFIGNTLMSLKKAESMVDMKRSSFLKYSSLLGKRGRLQP